MDVFNILAQTANNTHRQISQAGSIVPIDRFWEQITSLNVVESLTFIAFGSVCLLYGWRVFKMLVVINFGLIGLVLGMSISDRIVGLNQLAGGIIGMGILGVLSVPLMKWAVNILGAFAGGVIASGIWYAFGLNEQYLWAGAMTGIVAGGMLSFVIFKVAVMLFTSLWGSTLIVSGSLALLYIHQSTSEQIESLFFANKWFIPAIIILPTILGLFVQNQMVKDSKDWSI